MCSKSPKSQCGKSYPIVNHVPLLLNEENSVFSIQDISHLENSYLNLAKESPLRSFLKRVSPKVSKNIKGRKNYEKLGRMLVNGVAKPKVLIIGGRVLGEGMHSILSQRLEFVETDVAFGPRTQIICDAHDLPFEDESFDCVIIQAVLEHVVDPYACVEEIYRVLTKKGIVYAETPFMAQVHGRELDFTRFTHLGHRRLFRKFKEIDSGAVCGSGMALAWSWEYFLLSFVRSSGARLLTQGFARLTSFFLKYFDYYLINKPGVLDAASGYYFLGMRSESVLSDRELLKIYRGRKKIHSFSPKNI